MACKISHELEQLDAKICNENNSDSELTRYSDLKKELEKIEEKKARGPL